MVKILMVGDIVGAPGRTAFAERVAGLKERGEVDFVVANGENAAGGRGITQVIVDDLARAGADVITLGDHTWDRKEIEGQIDMMPAVLRPANFPGVCPGRGIVTVDAAGCKVTVVNLIGRVFMQPADCPFKTADRLLNGKRAGVVLVDIHAEATSEKVAMGRYLDGRATAVVGTHTHVQTSDETILPGGTGYITDLGMTGASNSVLGRDTQSVFHMFLSGMPARFKLAQGACVVEGVMLEVDRLTGRCAKISRVRWRLGNPE